MPGPTPLTAQHRLQVTYVASTFAHKLQAYCRLIASLDVTGYDIVGRGALGNIGVSAAVDALFTVMAVFYDPSVASFDGAILQVFNAGAWRYLRSYTTALVPTGGGGVAYAGGWDMVGKSDDNKNLHAYLYEGNFRLVDKQDSYAALNSSEKAVVDYFFRLGGTPAATDAYNWRRSTGDRYTERYLASVWDTNEKLRRLRRLK